MKSRRTVSARQSRRIAQRLGALALTCLRMVPFSTNMSFGSFTRRCALLALLASASLSRDPNVVNAAPPPPVVTSGTFLVNTTTDSGQKDSRVAVDDDGNFVVVWSGYSYDTSSYEIFGQLFDADGQSVGDEFQINTTDDDDQYEPEISMDADGNFVVVWTGYNYDTSDDDIFGQRFHANGTPDGDEFLINTETDDLQDAPSVAMDDDGNFMVVWWSYYTDGQYYAIAGQRFDAAGNTVDGEFVLNDGHDDGYDTSVAVDDNGDFVVAWNGYSGDTSSYDVFAQRLNSSGELVGDIIEVYADSYDQETPAVAVDSNGDFTVVWSNYTSDSSSYEIFGQRFDASGTAIGDDFLVSSGDSSYDSYDPSIAMDGSGNAVVTWEDEDSGDVGRIQRKRYNNQGVVSEEETTIATDYINEADNGSVAIDPTGEHYVMVWRGYNDDTSSYDIFGLQVVEEAPLPIDDVLELTIPSGSSGSGSGGSSGSDGGTGLSPNTFNGSNARIQVRFKAKQNKLRISRARFTLPAQLTNPHSTSNTSAATMRHSQSSSVIAIDDNVLELLSLTLQPGESYDLNFLADIAEEVSSLEELLIALDIETPNGNLSTNISLAQFSSTLNTSEVEEGSGGGGGCAMSVDRTSRTGVLAGIGALLGMLSFRRRRSRKALS